MAGLASYMYPGSAVPSTGGGGASQGAAVTPINAAASFTGSQSVAGSASLAGNPLLWLLLVTGAVLVVLHTI
jgi:hypothetical protein